jgi:hypothetical protein
MSTSASKIKIDEFADDDDTDETLPLPNLGHIATTGEAPMSGMGHDSADVIDERLKQLVDLSEAMHRTLEKIAELLAKQAPRNRPRITRKKKSARRKSPNK